MGSARHIPTENAYALYASSVVLALAIHAGMLYGWKDETSTLRALEAETAQTEVELFETASQSQLEISQDMPLEQSPPPAPSKEPPPPAPRLEPLTPPAPPEAPPAEIPLPVPTPPLIAVREPTHAPEQPQALQAPPPPSPSRPQLPGRSAPAQKRAPTPDNGTTRGDIAGQMLGKPMYKIPPVVKYPPESRAAGEQGTVVLRIRANAEGKPVEVTVLTSSGFSRLDRAAIEGGWRSRIENSFEGAQFEAPLRFSLKN